MGCVPRKGLSSSNNKKMRHSKDLVVDPGLFVQQNNLRFTEVYEIRRSLGKGAFGEVKEVKHRERNIIRAVKIFNKEFEEQDSHENLMNEVNMLKTVDHPNILRVLEFFEGPKKSYIVMELLKGGELFDEISKRKFFSEDDAVIVVKQIFSAVAYLHDRNIIHRDLKPENILLENKDDIKHLKISDFGTATLCKKNAKVRGALGTAYYIAPEVLLGNYGSQCDM